MARITETRMSPGPSAPTRAAEGLGRDPLWRELVGDTLRSARRSRGETLHDVSRRAGVSPQYLSEVERGLKEPSSEMLAAIMGALEMQLLDLTRAVAEVLVLAQPVSSRPASTHAAVARPAVECRAGLALVA